MTEPITHEHLDELVDIDPIRLRDEAFSLLAKVERLTVERDSAVRAAERLQGALTKLSGHAGADRDQLAAVWVLVEPWRSADFVSASLRDLVYGLLSIRDRAAIAAESSSASGEQP